MRRFLLALMLLPMLVLSTAAVQAAVPNGAVVGVLPFHHKAGTVEGLNFGDASAISNITEVFLGDSDRFTVAENEERARVMSEQAYNNQMTTDPQYRTNLGRLLGARYLIAGSVVGAGLKPGGTTVSSGVVGASGGVTKYTVEVMVTVKLIDVETGAIVKSAFGNGKSSSAKADFTLKRRGSTGTSTTDEYGYIEPQLEEHDVLIKISTGADSVSNIQFINAATKAVEDALFNKSEGLISKLDGTNKRSKR